LSVANADGPDTLDEGGAMRAVAVADQVGSGVSAYHDQLCINIGTSPAFVLNEDQML
jgi:hypothetical protein